MRLRRVDGSLDRKIVIGMVVSTEFIGAVRQIYQPEYMQVQFTRRVVTWCLDYFNEYGKAPGPHIQDIFVQKKDRLSPPEAEAVSDFLTSISKEYDEQGLDVTFLLDQTHRLFRKRSLETLVGMLQNCLETEELDRADEVLRKRRTLVMQRANEKGITARELLELNRVKRAWVIEEIFPEGLTLLAGKPKVGKGLFLLNAAVALCEGSDVFDHIRVTPSTALYLALEESVYTIKERLHRIATDSARLENLHIQGIGSWGRIDQGGLDRLEKWMEEHPCTRLIIIDTLVRFKAPQKAPGYHYNEDANSLAPLQEFAHRHKIAVIIVHHTKKSPSADIFDDISGTTGLTGIADTIAVLAQTGVASRALHLRGREVADKVLAFNFQNCKYTIREEDEEYGSSDTRKKILEYLKQRPPVTRKELVEEVGKMGAGKGLDVIIKKMVESGAIRKVDTGLYSRKKYLSPDEIQIQLEMIKSRMNPPVSD